jgi:DNA modification methylase
MNKDMRPISSLTLWDKNPRSISKESFESLKNKIKRWGQFKPLLMTPEGIIIGGNMRLRAYKELGISEAWVSEIHPKGEAEMIEIALADNELAGRWDRDALAELVYGYKDEINLGDYQLDLGKPADLNQLLSQYGPSAEEDEVPEVSDEPPVSVRGEIYELGQHRLMCGDSCSLDDVTLLMDGKKADMVFTDPPYNVNYGETMKDELRGGNRTIMNDNMGDAFPQFLNDVCVNLVMFTKGAIYICMSSSELTTLKEAFVSAGGHWSTFLIWVKNTFTMGRSDYQRQYEPILYGWKEGTDRYWCGARDQGDIWEVNRPTKNDLHPTMKPLELCERAIKNSSKTEDIVLDLFLGSGSTLIAAEQTGRVCFGMELDPKYCDVIRKRYAKYMNKEEEWQTLTPKLA